MVARAGHTSGPSFNADMVNLWALGAPVMGAVLNGARKSERVTSIEVDPLRGERIAKNAVRSSP